MSLSLSEVQTEQHEFRSQCQTLILATMNEDQWPEASYTPYVEDAQGCFYILISELAAHTRHLMNNGRVSWMLIADEQDTRQLFARKRFICKGQAQVIDRSEKVFETRLNQMKETFGEIIDLLSGLDDFHMMRLTPETATYVRGFGQAYSLSGEGLNQIEHLKRT